MQKIAVPILSTMFFVACTHTKPGTHVELVDKGGQKVYVSGAAGPGISKDIACAKAVNRAVAAIALRFAQEQDDVADDVAEAVGVDDGAVFLQNYAKDTARTAAVQDVSFDPIDHLCMATVRWTPPVFIKQAALAYAEKLKEKELKALEKDPEKPKTSATSTSTSKQEPAPQAAAPRPTASAPPPKAESVAHPAPEKASSPVKKCTKQKKGLAKALKAGQKAVDDFNECLGRTKGDEGICHRYKLWVEKRQKEEKTAGEKIVKCVNSGLSSKIRLALSKDLPGHAAVSVETRANGNLILWTFSPVDQTAFAFEVAPNGSPAGKVPLAANQVQWVREKLGL